MRRKGMTVREAAEQWVLEFSRFPYSMIEKLMETAPCSWSEVTVPAPGDRVYVFDLPDKDADGNELDTAEPTGEIREYREEAEVYLIELDGGEEILVEDGDFEVERDGRLPMWGTLWQFGDGCDDWWLDEKDGIRIMSECGFRIYEHEEWGYFFGIDGCGYDFYEAHWIPLYKKRGLQWHDERTEHTDDDIRRMLEPAKLPEKIVEKLLSMKPDQEKRFGGMYGDYISPDGIKAIEQTGHFSSRNGHEKVLEMHGYEDNDYVAITREV